MKKILVLLVLVCSHIYNSNSDQKIELKKINEKIPLVTKTISSCTNNLIYDLIHIACNLNGEVKCDQDCFDVTLNFSSLFAGGVGISTSITDIISRFTKNNVLFFSSLLPIANLWTNGWFMSLSLAEERKNIKKQDVLEKKLQKLNFFNFSKKDLTEKIIALADETIFKDDYDQEEEQCCLNKRLITQFLLTLSNGANFVFCPQEQLKYFYLANTIVSTLYVPLLIYKKIRLTHNPDEENNKQKKYREVFKSRIENLLKLYNFTTSIV